jgi:RNA polymerase sigma-70 factor, ECF subfamily
MVSDLEARGVFKIQQKVAAGAGPCGRRIQSRTRRRMAVGTSAGARMDFEDIYRSQRHRVYYLCLRMVGNEAEAEELTQDVFLQVYRKLNTFRGDSAFSTWLHRVAVNTVLMRLRKKAVPVLSLAAYREAGEDGSTALPGEPAIAPVDVPGRLWLEDALSQLSLKARVALFLHYVEGYRHREVAQMMGYSVHNAKSQLRRARLRLRQFTRSVEQQKQKK